MWGWIPQLGHVVFFWSTLVAAVFGGIGIGAAFISAMVGYELSEWSSRDANERISKAESDAKADIARARSDADVKIEVAREESKVAIAAANKSIERSRAEAANARLQTEQIKAVVAWRSIAPASASALEKALAEKPGSVNLRWMDGDPEALFLAIQISQILAKAHWQVAPGASKPANTIVFGIALPDTASVDAQTLRSAFLSAQIPFSPNQAAQGGVAFSVATIPGAPILMVGSRPPPQLP